MTLLNMVIKLGLFLGSVYRTLCLTRLLNQKIVQRCLLALK
jgi:hypothetical protein